MKMKQLPMLLLPVFLLSFSSKAQFKLLPLSDNGLKTGLQKVLSDFPTDFSHLKGDVLVENPQTVEYASLLQFSGAEDNSITKYSAARPVYSWQAVMLTTEDFEAASKKYKWLCSQLKGMTVKLSDYSFNLSGNYEAPDEGKQFFSSIYHLTPASTNLSNVKVEVKMEFYFPEWKVEMSVYQKERDDDEQGNTEENQVGRG